MKNKILLLLMANIVLFIFSLAKFKDSRELFFRYRKIKSNYVRYEESLKNKEKYENIVKKYQKRLNYIKENSKFNSIIDEVIYISDICKKSDIKPLEIKQYDFGNNSIIYLRSYEKSNKLFNLLKNFINSKKILYLSSFDLSVRKEKLMMEMKFKYENVNEK